MLRAGAPTHEGKPGAPGLTKCRLEREAHFLGGVFFGLKVLPKNGMARCQPGVQGAPADLVLLPEQGERGWAEGQKQRRDKAARSAVTGSLTESRFSAVPRMSPGVQLKPDPFPSGRAPPPVTARSVRGGWGLAARCPVTGPAPPARTRRPSRLFRHVTKPGDTGGANGARHPRNRPPPGAPRAGALGNSQRHAARHRAVPPNRSAEQRAEERSALFPPHGRSLLLFAPSASHWRNPSATAEQMRNTRYTLPAPEWSAGSAPRCGAGSARLFHQGSP